MKLVNHFYRMLKGRRRLSMPQQSFSELISDPNNYVRSESYFRLYCPWLSADFTNLLTSSVRENTMLGELKLYVLLSLLKQTRTLPGDIFEAGVWSGGSARLMVDYLASQNAQKAAWLLDTFAGYADVDNAKDGKEAQEGSVRGKSVDEVRSLFQNDKITVHVVPGTIPATLQQVHTETISFAHIDVNLYGPTLAATRFCLDRMPRGGIIVFDDYNWPATYGARMAIDEACTAFGQVIMSVPESTQAFLIRN